MDDSTREYAFAYAAVMNELPEQWHVEAAEYGFTVRHRLDDSLITNQPLNVIELLELVRSHWMEELGRVAPPGMKVIHTASGYLLRDAVGNPVGIPMPPTDVRSLLAFLGYH